MAIKIVSNLDGNSNHVVKIVYILQTIGPTRLLSSIAKFLPGHLRGKSRAKSKQAKPATREYSVSVLANNLP